MFNPKPKASLSSITLFKCAKNECGLEQFIPPDVQFRTIRCIHSKKTICTSVIMYLFQLKKLFQLSSGWVTTYYKSLKTHFQSRSKNVKRTPAAFLLMVRSVSITGLHSESDSLPDAPPMAKPACKSVEKLTAELGLLRSVFSCLTWVKIWKGFPRQPDFAKPAAALLLLHSYYHCEKIKRPYFI